MTGPVDHHLHAMSTSMTPPAGSARACCRERLCIASVTLADMRLSSDAAGAAHMQRHTGAAYTPAEIGTPLAESP